MYIYIYLTVSAPARAVVLVAPLFAIKSEVFSISDRFIYDLSKAMQILGWKVALSFWAKLLSLSMPQFFPL